MNKENNTQDWFSYQDLLQVLTIKFNTQVIRATYQIEKLHGGTVGAVFLITGLASSNAETNIAYKIVLKRQVKWERYGDVNSWRREYDLYHSNLNQTFSKDFAWPTCYKTYLTEDSFEIWMDYVDGYSGHALTPEMYVKAAEALGRFQGTLYRRQTDKPIALRNLSSKDYIIRFYKHYQAWDEVHDYIRSAECPLPKHLCDMMIEFDERSKMVFDALNQLPIVLCHRDYWNTNIFYQAERIIVIDWDTTGYGYFGEDIASLIADETDPSKMMDYFSQCIPAYQDGFFQSAGIKVNAYQNIHDIILMMFGYRLVESFKFAKNQADQNLAKDSLQAFYEMQKLIKR